MDRTPNFSRLDEGAGGSAAPRWGHNNWQRLRSLLEDIPPQNGHFDDFEVDHEFATIGRRTKLLNARRMYRPDNQTELILLAIEDITERKQAEAGGSGGVALEVRGDRLAQEVEYGATLVKS